MDGSVYTLNKNFYILYKILGMSQDRQSNTEKRKKRTPVCLSTLETIKSMRDDGDIYKKQQETLKLVKQPFKNV